MDFYNNNYAAPAAFGSTFVGYYVTNYQDALNSPAPITGEPPKAPETHTEPSSDDLSKRMYKMTSEIENLAKSLSTKKQEDKVDGSK